MSTTLPIDVVVVPVPVIVPPGHLKPELIVRVLLPASVPVAARMKFGTVVLELTVSVPLVLTFTAPLPVTAGADEIVTLFVCISSASDAVDNATPPPVSVPPPGSWTMLPPLSEIVAVLVIGAPNVVVPPTLFDSVPLLVKSGEDVRFDVMAVLFSSDHVP